MPRKLQREKRPEGGEHNDLPKRLETLGLHLNTPERAIICRSYRYALQPSGVTQHLADKHTISKLDRSGLRAQIRSLHLGDPNNLLL